jgi:glycosyltransferase involved in cell wall biosynthesis
MDITMVGSGQDRIETERAVGNASVATVTWLPWVSGDELPELVAAQDVCLGIFGTTAKALRVVPNKVFQGAAAGCVVITSDTAPQRRILGNAAIFTPVGDDRALAAALDQLATKERVELKRMQQRANAYAREAFTPYMVVAPLLKRLYQVAFRG